MSGFDWEGILGATGAGIQDAYDAMVGGPERRSCDSDDYDYYEFSEMEEDLSFGMDEILGSAFRSWDALLKQFQGLSKLTSEGIVQIEEYEKKVQQHEDEYNEEMERFKRENKEESSECDDYVWYKKADVRDLEYESFEWREKFFDQLLELFPELAGYMKKKFGWSEGGNASESSKGQSGSESDQPEGESGPEGKNEGLDM